MCLQDQERYNLLLTKEMGGFLNVLNQQHALLEEKLQVANVMIGFVSTMRKSKARSTFLLHKDLKLKLYYFTPNDHLELVEADQKSVWSANYQIIYDAEKARKQKEQERKKSSAMLEERIKQPLQGNLALSFLFKDQDLSDIIKQKVNEEESPLTRQTIASLGLDADQELDLTKIPGYYRNKHSHTVVTALDFMHKVRKTGVLTKFFSSPDPDFAGIRVAFD